MVGLVEGQIGRSYFDPLLPPFISIGNSMCIRATSGGNIAAPGPTRRASIWELSQLEF